jgi:hypothetical protein
MRSFGSLILAAGAALVLVTAADNQAVAKTRGVHPVKFNSSQGVPVLGTAISCSTIRSYAKELSNEEKERYRKLASAEQIAAARRCL